MSLVDRMRQLRDRLQSVPDSLGMPYVRPSIKIVVGASPGVPETEIETGIVKVGPPSKGKLVTLASSGVQVDETMIEVEVSSTLNSELDDGGLCRFYVDGKEWVPIHIEKGTLATRVVLKQQTDNSWRPYG